MESDPNKTNLPATNVGAQFYSLERPEPSPKYLELARAAPCRLDRPKKLLIVLDLNGTLLVRSRESYTSIARPFVRKFLEYCLKHHCVAIWSSARRRNVGNMLAGLFAPHEIPQLVTVWCRENSRLGEFVDQKVQVYKQLQWLWDDPMVKASACTLRDTNDLSTEKSVPEPCVWDQSNTVLVDDSLEKADSEPYNLLQVEEFKGDAGSSQGDVLGAVLAYIEDLAWERDVSSAIHYKPFECARSQGWNWLVGCPDFDNEQERNLVARDTQQEGER
jgi:hypothetical protein